MKLSKTAWNNVIIFSVMIIILLINSTNNRLFPTGESDDSARILPEHSVVLALTMAFPNKSTVMFERIGRAWKMTSQGRVIDLSNQQIEQMMFAWQQSSGLVQAADIVIDGQEGTQVELSLAGIEQEQVFTLYALVDQLLIFNHQKNTWLSLPSALSRQLIPVSDLGS